MNALQYAVQEALISLRRAGRSAATSVATIAIAFLTLGGFLLISTNLQQVVTGWASAAELSVYLAEGLDEASRDALSAEILGHPAVSHVEFVSKEAALVRFKADFPELGDLAATDSDNPFPDALEVRLRPDRASEGGADALAQQLAERSGVADVRYDRQWLARLLGMLTVIRLGGFAVAAVLVLGAAFTVAAVVRLSLEARHEELDIMQLVGAPRRFVRGPFVAEGTLLGGLGAALSLVLLAAGFQALRGRVQDAVAGMANVGPLHFLAASDMLLVVAAGLGVGALAGFVGSRVAA